MNFKSNLKSIWSHHWSDLSWCWLRISWMTVGWLRWVSWLGWVSWLWITRCSHMVVGNIYRWSAWVHSHDVSTWLVFNHSFLDGLFYHGLFNNLILLLVSNLIVDLTSLSGGAYAANDHWNDTAKDDSSNNSSDQTTTA